MWRIHEYDAGSPVTYSQQVLRSLAVNHFIVKMMDSIRVNYFWPLDGTSPPLVGITTIWCQQENSVSHSSIRTFTWRHSDASVDEKPASPVKNVSPIDILILPLRVLKHPSYACCMQALKRRTVQVAPHSTSRESKYLIWCLTSLSTWQPFPSNVI